MKVKSVTKGSLAWGMGLRPGDRMLSVNGHPVRDEIDLSFHASDEQLDFQVVRSGRERRFRADRKRGRPLGVVPEPFRHRRCANKCLFCFVDQMPGGLRPALYVKDEDYRLSFLHGNYLTLTGLGRADRDRIIAQRLSPLYVSVHATDEGVRGRLLGSAGPAPVLPVIRDLISHGIELHTQIVLCPGLNDGKVLERTIRDLTGLHPGVASIAVVPVGLTSHRHGLARLDPVNGRLAREILARYRPMQERLRKRFKNTLLYFSDEFYLLSGLDMPESIWYDDYPQIENGVGMARIFRDQFEEYSLKLPSKLSKGKKIAMVTGSLAKPILEPVAKRFASIRNLGVEIIAVKNRLFGPSVTVSGLLSGADILDALAGRKGSDLVALPGNVLNAEGLFIDGSTVRRFRSHAAPARVSFGLDELVKTVASWAG